MQLQEQLRTLMTQKGITQTDICRASGLNVAALNQWLKEKYKGDNAKIDDLIKGFIQRESEKNTIVKLKPDFVMTTIAAKVLKVARLCHLHSKIGVCYGEAGLGKTTAIKEYLRNNPDTVLIEADHGYNKKVFLQELHKAVGLEGTGSFHEMRNDIIHKLKNSGRLVIIDETEHLHHLALDTLRRIHDKTDYTFGILLVGLPRLYHNLRGKKGEHKYLSSRILHNLQLEDLTVEDVTEIIGNVIPNSKNLAKTFFEACQGKTRILINLIEHTIRLKEENSCEITKELIKSISDELARYY